MKKFNSIKKSRKKSKDIDEKIEYLDKECQKTGLNEITMSTSGIYQGTTSNPNSGYAEITGKSFNGKGFAMSGDSNLGHGNFGGATIRADGAALSPPHPVTGERRVAFTKGDISSGGSKIAIPGDKPTPSSRMTGPILWYWNPSGGAGSGSWDALEYNAPEIHGNSPFPTYQAGWGYWGSGAFGFLLLRNDGAPFAALFDKLKDTEGKQFDPKDSIPETIVLTKDNLDDPNFLPIDIKGISPQGFDYLKNKADEELLAGTYDLMKRGQVPFLTPDQVNKILVDPKFQKLLQDDPDLLPILQRMRASNPNVPDVPYDPFANEVKPNLGAKPGDQIAMFGGKPKPPTRKSDFKGIKRNAATTAATMSVNGMGMSPAAFEKKYGISPQDFLNLPENKTSHKKYLEEGVKLGHFDPEVLNVDINDIRKGIMPEFPKDPPEMIGGYSAKSRLVRKDPELPSFINVTRKDLAKNHLLTDKEIQDFLDDIKRINEYIKKNPAELIYAMTRYPKNDPRLAQLNFKMDEMKRASDQYVETHFPENEKLFNKLQDKIIKNIEQTDPKNFTGHKEAPKFDQTDISEQERRRRVIIRHFNKKKNKKLEESNWKPTTGSIANSTSQTFTYSSPNFETGEPNTFTTSGLSGVEAQQQSVKVNLGFGETENVSPPSYNQLSLAGYAKPILLRKRDPEEVNPKLDASQEFTKKNNSEVMMNARVDKGKGVGNSGISKDDADKLISSAGKFSKELQTFLNYLFNKGPKIIDNNYLGRNHVLKLFKDGFINDKGNFAVDDFIVGSGQKLTFNPNTGQYSVKFTYNFDDNATEIFKNPEKYRFMPGIHPKNFFLNARVILGGNYGLDALGIPGRLIEISKAFGGGQSKSGEITISPKDLMAQNPKLAQNYIQQKFGLTGPVWSPRMMGSPQGSNPSVTHNYYALYGKLPPRSVKKGSVPMNFGDHPEYDPAVIAKIKSMRGSSSRDISGSTSKDISTQTDRTGFGYDTKGKLDSSGYGMDPNRDTETQARPIKPSKTVNKIKGLAGEKARKELSLDQPITSPKKSKKKKS